MKSLKLLLPIQVIAASMLLTGCVTGRRTVELSIPSMGAVESTKGAAAVTEVTDHRAFEQKPASPSTPSVTGQLDSKSKEELSSLIGRQRNGYGKAMGDVALPENETIEKRAKALVEEGLKRRGYAIESSVAQASVKAKVDVLEFWGWFSPGFASVSFEARVDCKITIESDGKTDEFEILGYGINKGQVASNANWQLAYQRAFDDFLEKLDEQLKSKGY